jgi:hypothetical protein
MLLEKGNTGSATKYVPLFLPWDYSFSLETPHYKPLPCTGPLKRSVLVRGVWEFGLSVKMFREKHPTARACSKGEWLFAKEPPPLFHSRTSIHGREDLSKESIRKDATRKRKIMQKHCNLFFSGFQVMNQRDL